MFDRLSGLSRHPRFASCVLVFAMFYQLGACPCGCLDHNTWVQWMGFDSSEPVSVAALSDLNDPFLVADPDPHDCSGQPRLGFVDNARAVRFFDPSKVVLEHGLDLIADSQFQPLCEVEKDKHDSACRSAALARSRPALQVFRL